MILPALGLLITLITYFIPVGKMSIYNLYFYIFKEKYKNPNPKNYLNLKKFLFLDDYDLYHPVFKQNSLS